MFTISRLLAPSVRVQTRPCSANQCITNWATETGAQLTRELHLYVVLVLCTILQCLWRVTSSLIHTTHFCSQAKITGVNTQSQKWPPSCSLGCPTSVLRLHRSTNFLEKASVHALHASTPTRWGGKARGLAMVYIPELQWVLMVKPQQDSCAWMQPRCWQLTGSCCNWDIQPLNQSYVCLRA